jgi:hypothetical protein
MVATLPDAPSVPVALLQQALDRLSAAATSARTYQAYYTGLHAPVIRPDRAAAGLGLTLTRFRDNLSAPVVDAVADRLAVVGIAGQRPEDAAAAQEAWAIWQMNRLPRRSGDAHLAALTTGDAYLVVWPDADGLPRIDWSPATLMTAAYDGERADRLAWAIKAWVVVDSDTPDGRAQHRWRVNVYRPDAIYKLASPPWTVADGASVAAASLPSARQLTPYAPGDEPWPLPNPLAPSLPVVHLANNPAGEGEDGASELRDVLPLQDGLNATLVNMLVAMEFVAYPQRHVTGLEIQRDEQGRAIAPFSPGASKLWQAENPDVKFGQFEPAELTQLLATADMFRHDISRVSGVPSHYFGLDDGGWPSGEALKSSEARLVKKVIDRQRAFGGAWEQALTLALRLLGRAPAALEITWASAETRERGNDVATQQGVLEICASPAPYGARHRALTDLGYAADEAAAMLADMPAPPKEGSSRATVASA